MEEGAGREKSAGCEGGWLLLSQLPKGIRGIRTWTGSGESKGSPAATAEAAQRSPCRATGHRQASHSRRSQTIAAMRFLCARPQRLLSQEACTPARFHQARDPRIQGLLSQPLTATWGDAAWVAATWGGSDRMVPGWPQDGEGVPWSRAGLDFNTTVSIPVMCIASPLPFHRGPGLRKKRENSKP